MELLSKWALLRKFAAAGLVRHTRKARRVVFFAHKKHYVPGEALVATGGASIGAMIQQELRAGRRASTPLIANALLLSDNQPAMQTSGHNTTCRQTS